MFFLEKEKEGKSHGALEAFLGRGIKRGKKKKTSKNLLVSEKRKRKKIKNKKREYCFPKAVIRYEKRQ